MSGQARRSRLAGPSDRAPLSSDLKTKVEFLDDGMLILSIDGELDPATSTRFESELRVALRSRAPAAILDLTKCGFLDCSALGALVRTDNARGGAGTRFSLVVPHRNVRAICELTGLDSRFELHPTRTAALTGRTRRLVGSATNPASALAARPHTRETVELRP